MIWTLVDVDTLTNPLPATYTPAHEVEAGRVMELL